MSARRPYHTSDEYAEYPTTRLQQLRDQCTVEIEAWRARGNARATIPYLHLRNDIEDYLRQRAVRAIIEGVLDAESD